MQEDFLHYVWQFKKFNFSEAKTVEGLPVTIIESGMLNQHSGPDFFNARLRIGEQQWAGNVEIHINSSDWYVHGHENDPAYDNVILHVVWKHDANIFRKDNSVIPVLELENIIEKSSFSKFEMLMSKRFGKWINCEKDFAAIPDFEMDHWLERIYFERLEEKSAVIHQMLESSSNDWEAVLFKMIAKNFGLNVNGAAFLSLANSIPFSVVRKAGDQKKLEALFFGQAGLLEADIDEEYYLELQREYGFLKHKFCLDREGIIPAKFFRLRPDNFPTIRLAQLAAQYNGNKNLFSEIMSAQNLEEIYLIFQVQLSEFWENHYTFRKTHRKKKKQFTRKFIDLLIINTLVPLKFCFAQQHGRDSSEEIMQLISAVKPEVNQTIEKFERLRPAVAPNAMKSQALLQLKQAYCDKNRCLKCNLGIKLLQKEL